MRTGAPGARRRGCGCARQFPRARARRIARDAEQRGDRPTRSTSGTYRMPGTQGSGVNRATVAPADGPEVDTMATVVRLRSRPVSAGAEAVWNFASPRTLKVIPEMAVVVA